MTIVEPGPAPRRITAWLRHRPGWVIAVWAMLAAFSAYGCMYAFRKPFSAASYRGTVGGMDYKTLLVLAQITGYTISKFLGIKFVSEATPARRGMMVLGLIGFAELALVLFAIVPTPWNAAFLFLNGIPLGMVWGLIFAFLEGRRVTEWMVLGLSMSLIFSSGWVKAVGLYLIRVQGVNEFWMPALTGLVFLPPLLISLWMLRVLPPPDAADVAARTLRQPMDRDARRSFMRRYWPAIVPLVGGYVSLMTYRDVRDTFQVDVFRELGMETSASQLAGIETKVGILVMLALGLFSLIRSNRHAFNACCGLIAFGGLFTAASTALWQAGIFAPQTWMAATGVGLYTAFVAYQAIVFERLLASLKVVGTAAFLITVCDSYGYLSTIGLYLFKLVGGSQVSWVRILTWGGYAIGALLPCLVLIAAIALGRWKGSQVADGLTSPSR